MTKTENNFSNVMNTVKQKTCVKTYYIAINSQTDMSFNRCLSVHFLGLVMILPARMFINGYMNLIIYCEVHNKKRPC